jgi:hypothetical protein
MASLVARKMDLSEVVRLTRAQISAVCFHRRDKEGRLVPPRVAAPEGPPAAPELGRDLRRLRRYEGRVPHQRYAALLEQLLDAYNVPADRRGEYRNGPG